MASHQRSTEPRQPQAIGTTEGKKTFPRRDFLNGVLMASSAVVLGACSDKSTNTPADAARETGGPAPAPPPDADADANADSGVEVQSSHAVGPDGSADAVALPKADKGDVYAMCHEVRDGKSFVFPPPSPSEPVYDCIVVGGGISGLTAAWKLRRLGYDNILVLEKDDPVGGFSRMDGGEPTFYSRAAAYSVFPYNEDLIELYQELGMVRAVDDAGVPTIDDKFVLRAPVNCVFMDGKWRADAWEAGMDALPLPPKALADLKAFRADMLAWYDYVGSDEKMAFDSPTEASTAEVSVRALDTISLAEYIASKGWDRAVADFFDPYCQSAFGTTVDAVSAWSALNFLGSEFGICMSQPGGNGYLSKMIADKVGASRIRTNAFVLRAKAEGAEVLVSYNQGGASTTVGMNTLRAKTVIFAAPRFIAKYLLPDMVAAGRNEGSGFEYTPYVVANIHVSQTPPGLGYDNWVPTGSAFFTDFIVADWPGLAEPSAAPLSRPNVLTVYCPMLGLGARMALLSQPIDYFVEKILSDLEKVLPGVGATVTAFDLYRWGHAMVASKKGFVFGKARADASKPLGNIFFACTDVDGLPAFENAVGSAIRAAGEAVAVL